VKYQPQRDRQFHKNLNENKLLNIKPIKNKNDEQERLASCMGMPMAMGRETCPPMGWNRGGMDMSQRDVMM
jgi:hypothetical protein